MVSRALMSFLLVPFAVAAASADRRPAEFQHYESTRLSMACVYAIEAYGNDSAKLPQAVNEAFDEVDRIDRLMSHYNADSPLSRINRDAASGTVSIEPELFEFIADALRYTRESNGAFDITVGPLMKAWGFFRGEGRMPDAAGLADARRHVGAAHVIMDPGAGSIRFDEPGVELDLGGIAKGYAVDRATAVLRARGVSAGLISAGGSTIYGLGAPPGRPGWTVALQDPLDSRRTARSVVLRDGALSVAGSSEKSFEFDGVRYSHIMDPRTGRPVQDILTVAVQADTGTAGDALDDALFVLGPARSSDYLTRWPGVHAFFFVPAGDRSWTVVERGVSRRAHER
jgi:thiamine biosynthesis lipoprotein